MARIRLSLLFFLMVVFGISLSAQDAEFQKAIKKKVITQDGYYFVDLSKKNYSKNAVSEYAKKNGYTLYDVQEKTVALYGNMATIVVSVKMLPKGESRQKLATSSQATESSLTTSRDRGGDLNSSLAKAFKSAIRDGRDNGGVYGAVVMASIPNDEIISYAQSLGYHVIRFDKYITNKNNLTGVNEKLVSFMKIDEMASWILEKSFNLPSNQRYQTGSLTLFDGKTLDGVTWSGNVKGGRISGDGYGAKFIDSETVFVVRGTFTNGKVSGRAYYRFGPTPEKDGIFRIAGGKYKDLNANKKTLSTNYVLVDAGEYAGLFKSGDDVFKLERANYLWDNYKNKSFLQYKAGDKYVEGAYWCYADADLKPIVKFPIETRTEELQPFKNGKAVIRNCNVHPRDHQTIDDLEWVDYYVYRDGKITFSDSEKNLILQLFDNAMSNWGQMQKEFNVSFSNPANYSLLYETYGPKQDWERHLWNCILDDANLFLRTNRANAKYYTAYSNLLQLYEIYHSKTLHPEEWNMNSKISVAMDSYTDRSYSDRKGREEQFFKYLKEDWMTRRKNTAVSLVDRLKKDREFNVPDKEVKLNAIIKGIEDLEYDYNVAAREAYWKLCDKMCYTDKEAELQGDIFDMKLSKNPSDLERHQDIFLSWYYTYSEDGEIRFIGKNDYVQYNAIYDEVGDKIKLRNYIINYNTLDSSLNGVYFSFKEMQNAIIKAWAKRYH